MYLFVIKAEDEKAMVKDISGREGSDLWMKMS
jgi:hypothetical protein